MDQPVLTDLFVVEVEQLGGGGSCPQARESLATSLPPIAPSASIQAKHCSAMGALTIERFRKSLWRRMLELYRIDDRTDAEIAAILCVAPSTISARRKELMQQGLVKSAERTRKNARTGISNSLWGLTEKGRQR